MKQHIFGFILFTLIVGTAGLISAFFTELPSRDAVKVFDVQRTVEYKSSCWKQVKSPTGNFSARVVQATLNQKTKQLETDLLIERETSSVERINLTLYFFSNDTKGKAFHVTEKVWIEPYFNSDNKATQTIKSSYRVNDLESYENLYVMVESKSGTSKSSESNAVPVLRSF